MGKILAAAAATFLLASAPFATFAAEAKPAPLAPPGRSAAVSGGDYRIGAGDVLNVDVWKDPVLTRLLAVLPDGKVAYPLIGELTAAGKTVEQLKKEIAGKLARYMKDPVGTVEVRQMNSLNIYVLGRVHTPGRTVLSSNVNVLQALAIAGGPTPYANRTQIRIFRQEGTRTLIIPFDYDEVTEGKNLESNIVLKRGDVVYVP